MVAVGLFLVLYAVLGVREVMPNQVAAVLPPVSSASPAPTTPPSTDQTDPTPAPKPTTAIAAGAVYVKYPNLGDRVGTITLPTLKLSWPIYQGTTDAQFAKGVGHYLKSVLPGQTDNTVLAGHRTTVFNRLGELKIGQNILIKTSAGVFTYKIAKFRIVDRSDRTVIVPTKSAVLTLTTCYPFNNVGATTKSFIVVANLVD